MDESASTSKRNDTSRNDVGGISTSQTSRVPVPTFPPPVARPPSHERRRHDSKDLAYKSESLSSMGESPTVTPITSVDLEKGSLARDARRARHHKSTSDPEKSSHHHSRDHRHQQQHVVSTRLPYPDDEVMDDTRFLQEEKAVKILLFLSFPCAILSALNAAWTIVSLVITVLTQPVRLCARRPTFGQQLGGLVGPALNLQLKCIFTPLPPHANEDTSYRPCMLVAVQLLSPFLSMGITLAAWVVATYWIISTIVGDPAGMDKRDDGRETALALRDWWEKWLIRSIKDF